MTPKFDPEIDYYKLLDLLPSATVEEIRSAYRQKAKELHPDLNPDDPAGASLEFQQLSAAYEVLSDPETRRAYDLARWRVEVDRRKKTRRASSTGAGRSEEH